MNARRLPRVPMFLLTRFAVGPRHDSVVGDIVEQFHHGRSAAWFWSQTLTAIAASPVYDLRNHKVLAVRALLLGWAAFAAGAWIANRLTAVTRGRLIGYVTETGNYSVDALFWSSQVPSIAFSYLACAICGWLIARAHRSAPSVFLLFAASVFALEYGLAAFMLAQAGVHAAEIPGRGLILLVALIGRPVVLLVGGFAGLKARATSEALSSSPPRR